MQSVKTQGEGVKRVSLYTRREGQFIHKERGSVNTKGERVSEHKGRWGRGTVNPHTGSQLTHSERGTVNTQGERRVS